MPLARQLYSSHKKACRAMASVVSLTKSQLLQRHYTKVTIWRTLVKAITNQRVQQFPSRLAITRATRIEQTITLFIISATVNYNPESSLGFLDYYTNHQLPHPSVEDLAFWEKRASSGSSYFHLPHRCSFRRNNHHSKCGYPLMSTTG